MNYFAHGRHYLDRPYFLAGTAVPDWLNVVNRRAKARSKAAAAFTSAADERVAELAQGIVQHHEDDGWFHQTRAFVELNLQFAVDIRDRLDDDLGFRPSFLGHILVELLLDSVLIEQHPAQLDNYYTAIDEIDAELVTATVNSIATQPVDRLQELIPRFSTERFLYDYTDDEKLLTRLNHVMRRVKLPLLPPSMVEFLAKARPQVRERHEELLTRPADR